MSTLPSRTARRLVKPSWKDARLIVGVLLVLLSVVIGSAAFSAADDRVGVWAAAHPLTPGQEVSEGDFTRVDVQLGDAAADYIRTDGRLPADAVMDRPVRAGELVPRTAVVDPSDTRVREVPVRVDPIYLTNLRVGSRVTVYVPEPVDGEDAPEDAVTYTRLLERAMVASLPEDSGSVLGSGAGASAVIVVPEDQVADLISLDQEDTPVKLVLESGDTQEGSR